MCRREFHLRFRLLLFGSKSDAAEQRQDGEKQRFASENSFIRIQLSIKTFVKVRAKGGGLVNYCGKKKTGASCFKSALPKIKYLG